MKIHIDIRDDIPPTVALRCVENVVKEGRVSANGTMFCYATSFNTHVGDVWVSTRPYRKSDCFVVHRNKR